MVQTLKRTSSRLDLCAETGSCHAQQQYTGNRRLDETRLLPGALAPENLVQLLDHVLLLVRVVDVEVEHLAERLRVLEHRRQQEVQQRPQLVQVVLDAERETGGGDGRGGEGRGD